MIESLIEALGGWTWWIIGLVLLGVEVLAPGLLFLWFGVAAILIGVGALFFPWPWQVQVLGFAILAVAAALIGPRLLGTSQSDSPDSPLNEPMERLKGRTFVLTEPIVEGSGRVRIDDSVWRVAGPDLPAGTRIVVTGAAGTMLKVEADNRGA